MLYIYKKNKQNMGFKSNFLFSTSFIVFLFALMFPINGLFASSTLKGMQLGDSDAPVKIIEYRSLTCSHCADFSNDTFAEIKENYIDKGKVNFELRPFALNAIDLNAFKLLHCVDENDFFAMDKILFKDSSNFSKRLAKIKEGRLLIFQKCEGGWCRVKTKKIKGWIKVDNVWGLIN